MPSNDWDSGTNRFLFDTLPACATPPTLGNDLCNKTYVDGAVGGAAIFMSMYANPQAAVDAAIASGVNAVFVDDVFSITVPVNLNSDGLALVGIGKDTGFIVDDVAATGALTIPNANVVVTNLSIHVTTCAAAANVILVTGNGVLLEDLRVTFTAAVVAARGVYLNGGDEHVLTNVTVDATGATVTTGIDGASGVDDCRVTNCFVVNADGDGIYLTQCDYWIVAGCRIDTAGDNGIELAGTSTRNSIDHNVMSACTGDAIELAGTADYNLVTSNQVPDGITQGAGAGNEFAHNMY